MENRKSPAMAKVPFAKRDEAGKIKQNMNAVIPPRKQALPYYVI